jgi:hypothetical protein
VDATICNGEGRDARLFLEPHNGLGAGDILYCDLNLIAVANGIEDQAVLDLELLCLVLGQPDFDCVVTLVDAVDDAAQGVGRRLARAGRPLRNCDNRSLLRRCLVDGPSISFVMTGLISVSSSTRSPITMGPSCIGLNAIQPPSASDGLIVTPSSVTVRSLRGKP